MKLEITTYGKPCKMDEIQTIADKYGLKVIYDAAHAFGVEVPAEEYGLKPETAESSMINGQCSILSAGDMSTLSFHATKVYNTLEGGALVMHDEQTKKQEKTGTVFVGVSSAFGFYISIAACCLGRQF